jgi:hypothetical protein
VGVEIVWKAGTSQASWADVDIDRSYLILHNSWGPSWGTGGRAKLSVRDFDRLLSEEGDAVFPRRNPDRLSIEEPVPAMTFSDIQDSVHKEAIEWAANLGIVTGYTDASGERTFKPNNLLTRGQICSILKRFADTLQ